MRRRACTSLSKPWNVQTAIEREKPRLRKYRCLQRCWSATKRNSYRKEWGWLGDWPLFQNGRQNMMTKPRTMKQVLLDDVKADPNDPRVARVLEILERKRAGRVPNEQNAEYRKFMGELIEEARAKGRPV